MNPLPAHDPEGPWIALMCVGILLTSMSATTCLALIVLYQATVIKMEPVLVLFGVGALVMLAAATRLEVIAFQRARTPRR